MDYQAFASDLPPHRTIVFQSAEENEETMRRHGVTQELRQLGKGNLRCGMAVLSTEQADLYADRFNKAFSMRLAPPTGSVGLLLLRSVSGYALASGENGADDKLIVVPDGSETDIVAPDLVGSEAMTVPNARFIEMAEALCPARESVLPGGTVAIRVDRSQLQDLRRTVLDLVSYPESDPRRVRLSNLLAEVIGLLGDASSQWRPQGFTANQMRRRVARLAQEFIEEHHDEAIRMEDLCRETGFGVRTVQRCFREYFDLTVSEYLKALRLDAARRELAVAHPSHHLVTEIALRHGFRHLGRFSVEFRQRFGESPSQTLARERV
jgi:AraC-like DNA-binding protein